MDNITASRAGTAGPYIAVSPQYAQSLYEHLKEQGYSCASPREGGSRTWVIDTPHKPKEIALGINSWLKQHNIRADSSGQGDADDPTAVEWEFEAPTEG